MATLYEKFYHHGAADTDLLENNPQELAEVLLDLYDAVEAELFLQAAPEDLVIDEEGVSLKAGAVFQNLYYAAPEVAVEGREADKNSGWFTLGLLMYFVMTGRSYYADKELRMVDLPDLMEQGNGLIAAESEEEESLYGLLMQSIEKLTAWDPEKREEGVELLLDIFQEPEDELEEAEEEPEEEIEEEAEEELEEEIEEEPEEEIRETTRKARNVKEDSAKSKKAEKDTAKAEEEENNKNSNEKLDHFLFVKDSSTQKLVQLMKLGEQEQEYDFEVVRDITKRYFFYLVKGDPVKKRVVSKQEVYHLDIPEDPDGGIFQLRVTHHPQEGCTLALYDAEGISQISDNVMCFQVATGND